MRKPPKRNLVSQVWRGAGRATAAGIKGYVEEQDPLNTNGAETLFFLVSSVYVSDERSCSQGRLRTEYKERCALRRDV